MNKRIDAVCMMCDAELNANELIVKPQTFMVWVTNSEGNEGWVERRHPSNWTHACPHCLSKLLKRVRPLNRRMHTTIEGEQHAP